jgi:hypothetical protein
MSDGLGCSSESDKYVNVVHSSVSLGTNASVIYQGAIADTAVKDLRLCYTPAECPARGCVAATWVHKLCRSCHRDNNCLTSVASLLSRLALHASWGRTVWWGTRPASSAQLLAAAAGGCGVLGVSDDRGGALVGGKTDAEHSGLQVTAPLHLREE